MHIIVDSGKGNHASLVHWNSHWNINARTDRGKNSKHYHWDTSGNLTKISHIG